MRIVMNQYADGHKFAVETATDGSVVMRDLLGERKVAWNGWKDRWSICWQRFGSAVGNSRVFEKTRSLSREGPRSQTP